MTSFPASVKVLPVMLCHGLKARASGGLRAWQFGKALDVGGSGWVKLAELRAFLRSLGVDDRLARGWLLSGRETGIISYKVIRGVKVAVLVSPARACFLLGIPTPGARPALVSCSALAGKGWKSAAWVALISTFRGRPVSRETLERLTGVERTEQWRLERGQPVEKKHNFGVGARVSPDHVQGLDENTRRQGVFILGYGPLRGRIAWRLPDCRVVPDAVLPCKGRTRKVRSSLKRLSILRRPMFDEGEYQRVFYPTMTDASQAARRIGARDQRQDECYYPSLACGDTWQAWVSEGVLPY